MQDLICLVKKTFILDIIKGLDKIYRFYWYYQIIYILYISKNARDESLFISMNTHRLNG